MLMIFKAARVTDGAFTVIFRETSGSVNSAIECGVVMISIPIPIVVVISKALVLQHGRLAKKHL
jgi:hypothetical protein